MEKEILQQLGQFKRAVNGNMFALHEANAFIRQLSGWLFPVLQENIKDETSDEGYTRLRSKLEKLLIPVIDDTETSSQIAHSFFIKIPEIYECLVKDAQFIHDNDPASKSIEEVIICYPGFYAIVIHRLAHELHKLNVPLLPRVFANYSQRRTSIDIHPGAKIESPFFIDHGTGVVIGETTEIGKHVKIYQGVTLGALSVNKDQSQTKRHPTIKDGVTIYSGSTILGGKTVIGKKSIIGGNVWLTKSIEPETVVLNKSEIHVKSKLNNFLEPINYSI